MALSYLDLVDLVEGAPSTDVRAWLRDNSQDIKARVEKAGAVLLRGFDATDPEIAGKALQTLSDELLEDAFWSTPRTGVSGKTFTATEYPGPRTIALHSEMAYMNTFPRFLCFHSIRVAEAGGETTLGPLDRISKALGDVLAKFEGGVKYVRNYHPGVDIPWQQAFRVKTQGEAEAIARKMGMQMQWLDGGSLRTTHTAQGVATAEDGSNLWFNQSHVFHASNLSAKERAAMSEIFGEDGLPRNATFSNGTPIPDETIVQIHTALEDNTAGVEWQSGDVLFVDNMRFMHGRRPFSGERKVHVAMAQAQAIPKRIPPFQAKSGIRSKLFGLFGQPKAG